METNKQLELVYEYLPEEYIVLSKKEVKDVLHWYYHDLSVQGMVTFLETVIK